MRPGALIDYRIRLQGVPLRWRSEITAWEPPYRFVDEQVRGPYRLWHHEHTFRREGDYTRVIDHVRYAVWGGALVERLFVRDRLDRIFRFRHQRIAELLGVAPIPVPPGKR
jgi:ligand-binding SRPBCC domain-containing protein